MVFISPLPHFLLRDWGAPWTPGDLSLAFFTMAGVFWGMLFGVASLTLLSLQYQSMLFPSNKHSLSFHRKQSWYLVPFSVHGAFPDSILSVQLASANSPYLGDTVLLNCSALSCYLSPPAWTACKTWWRETLWEHQSCIWVPACEGFSIKNKVLLFLALHIVACLHPEERPLQGLVRMVPPCSTSTTDTLTWYLHTSSWSAWYQTWPFIFINLQ